MDNESTVVEDKPVEGAVVEGATLGNPEGAVVADEQKPLVTTAL